MRGNHYIIKTAKLLLFAALLLVRAFLFAPSAKTALTLPMVGCESQQENFFYYYMDLHTTSDMSRETGETAFTYGNDNNSFVSESGNKILFNIKILFTPDNPNATVRILSLDSGCNIVFGFGPAYSNLDADAPNVISFDKDNYNVEYKGDIQTSRTSGVTGIVRYLWVEVWNGKYGDEKKATYSYLVDINNLQNPSGSLDDDAEPSGKRPVLIIPGIMGSELYNDTQLIWANQTKIAFNPTDDFLYDNLKLDDDGLSVNNINVGNIIKRIVKVNTFEGLLDYFGTKPEYEGKIFVHPYDWRIDIDNNKRGLNTKIEGILNNTGFKKVDIIAHSMGGLVVQSYLKEYGSTNINKLIFVGTPHLGAPKAAKSLLFGDIEIPFGLVNWDTIKKLSKNSPSIYQLLPDKDYFPYESEYLALINRDTAKVDNLSFEQSLQFFKDQNLNSTLIDQAVIFQDDINNYDIGNIDLYNIVGCKNPTGGKYILDDKKTGIASTQYISGDGTVPLKSADFVTVPLNHAFYVKNGGHSALPSLENVRTLITDILSGSINTYTDIRNDSNDCALKGRQYEWHSPVEIHIYDSLGNHAGPTATGFENNIPNVTYDIIDGEKFIYIPDDGQSYRIEGVGEGTGTFDLKIITYDNGNITQTQVFNDVPVTTSTQIRIEPTTPEIINYDYIGSGNFNAVEPSSTLTDNFSDNIPPVTNITKLTYDETADIALSATDSESGVLEIKYSVDSGDYQVYNNRFFVLGDGTHSINYYAVDNSGNNETIKRENFTLYRHSNSTYEPPEEVTEQPIQEEGKVLGETIQKQLENDTIIRDGYTFYYLENNKKRLFRTYEELLTYVESLDDIREATVEELKLENGEWMPAKKGTLILDTRDGRTVYIIDEKNVVSGFATEKAFLERGYKFENVIKLNLSDYIIYSVIK